MKQWIKAPPGIWHVVDSVGLTVGVRVPIICKCGRRFLSFADPQPAPTPDEPLCPACEGG